MALIGYARVSTTEQNPQIQVEQLHTANCTKIFTEQKSGTNRESRVALNECLEYMRDGETLVITKIDRLARSARDLHNIVHELEQRNISLVVLHQAIDTKTPTGKAFLGMLAIFAEFETNIRKERQLEGIEKAKTEGRYEGRKPTAQLKRDEVMALLATGLSKPKIAKQLGMSVASVYNVINSTKGK